MLRICLKSLNRRFFIGTDVEKELILCSQALYCFYANQHFLSDHRTYKSSARKYSQKPLNFFSQYNSIEKFLSQTSFEMADNKYCVEYAKRGTSGCKKCKVKIDKGAVRVGKVVPNPFTDDGGEMKQWFHVNCIFDSFQRARATTKIIEEPEDLEGWESIEQEDKDEILRRIKEVQSKSQNKTPSKKTKPKETLLPVKESNNNSKGIHTDASPSKDDDTTSKQLDPLHRDNSFREFRRLCAKVAEEPSYNSKTAIFADFFKNGTSGDGFESDLYLWVKMLLPAVQKRIYNLQSKQLVKLFGQIFNTDQEEMIEHLEQGDVAETVRIFFEQSKTCVPCKKSLLTLQEVDDYLEELCQLTKEEEQMKVLKKIAKRCTGNDLKMVVRLIKHDLRISAGPKHVLEAIYPDAYQAFQASRDLKNVLERITNKVRDKPGLNRDLSIKASVMTPVLPMLAQPCKSVEEAMKKCPNGMFSEIKYDGERVQVHKKGNKFSYFSRSLKPVLPHKVQHFEKYIPQAFQHGNDLILDSEVLLVNKDGVPLPFGTLGKHKKTAFQDANVCLFIFDCIHYNGENLMPKSIKERRKILKENMVEIPNRILFSESKVIYKPDDLKDMIIKVLKEGLEGLVLKDLKSPYEPGKRHWLKVKKDYLNQGAMADSADLVVLGAFYGTGQKGGMMSIFLMGCYNPGTKKWCTVTKVSGGHDDKTLDRLQTELDMVKISKDSSKVPSWLNVTKTMIPDFVCRDPKEAQVWEIVGAEFSKAEVHTANGISIRFPRVTKIRTDKTWKEATTLYELEALVKKSKEASDIPDVLGDSPSKKKNSNGNDDDNENDSDSNNSKNIRNENNNSFSSPIKKGKPPNKGSPAKESPIKGKKHPLSESQNCSPPKKAKVDCQYGSKCFQKNPEHLKMYNHPKDAAGHPTINPLPDIFAGVKALLLKDHLPDSETLKRYLIAYDGDVLEDIISFSEATHIVVGKKTIKKDLPQHNPLARVVTPDWLWDCIKLQKLLPTAPYETKIS